jgi:hypothetical protein
MNTLERKRLRELVRLGDTDATWELWRDMERKYGYTKWRFGTLPNMYWLSIKLFNDSHEPVPTEHMSTLVSLLYDPIPERWMVLYLHPKTIKRLITGSRFSNDSVFHTERVMPRLEEHEAIDKAIQLLNGVWSKLKGRT